MFTSIKSIFIHKNMMPPVCRLARLKRFSLVRLPICLLFDSGTDMTFSVWGVWNLKALPRQNMETLLLNSKTVCKLTKSSAASDGLARRQRSSGAGWSRWGAARQSFPWWPSPYSSSCKWNRFHSDNILLPFPPILRHITPTVKLYVYSFSHRSN